jgi:predicted secreted hydrolase
MSARRITRRHFAGAAALLALAAKARAQGFAGLEEKAGRLCRVVRGRTFSFPADHGPHPEFRIEWWYVTANLRDAAGKPMARNGRCSGRRCSRARRWKAGRRSRPGWRMPR